MKHLIPSALGLILFFSACTKDPADQPIPKANNNVKISNLQIGQKTRFIRFTAQPCDPITLPVYVKDTLVLEVIGIQGSEVTFREYYTPNSISLLTPPGGPDAHPYGNTDESKLFAKIENTGLNIYSVSDPGLVSRLFPRLPFQLSTTANVDTARVVKDWFIKQDGKTAGYITNYQQRSVSYPTLNVATDYDNMAVEGLGFFHLYEPNGGIIRSAFLFSSCTESGGWDFLD